MRVGSCWLIPRGVLLREIARIPENPRSFHVSGAETDRTFSLTDSWLYMFHSQVAFFALGIVFDEIETLADIVNLVVDVLLDPPTSVGLTMLNEFRFNQFGHGIHHGAGALLV